MKRKRNRAKQTASLQYRLTEEAQRLRREAQDVPSSDERTRLLSKAQQLEEAAELDELAELDEFLAIPPPAPAA